MIRDALGGHLRVDPKEGFLPRDILSLRRLLRRGGDEGGRRPWGKALHDPGGLAVVAEWVDPPRGGASPFDGGDALGLARILVDAGVQAFAVGTECWATSNDPRRIAALRSAHDRPVLRLDWVLDEIDVAMSRLWGADAILLHPSILGAEVARIVGLARAFDLETLAVVGDQRDLEVAFACGAGGAVVHGWPYAGRRVDPSLPPRLGWQVPAPFPALLGAGVDGPEEAIQARGWGYDGISTSAALVVRSAGDRALAAALAREAKRPGGLTLPHPLHLRLKALMAPGPRGPRFGDLEPPVSPT